MNDNGAIILILCMVMGLLYLSYVHRHDIFKNIMDDMDDIKIGDVYEKVDRNTAGWNNESPEYTRIQITDINKSLRRIKYSYVNGSGCDYVMSTSRLKTYTKVNNED